MNKKPLQNKTLYVIVPHGTGRIALDSDLVRFWVSWSVEWADGETWQEPFTDDEIENIGEALIGATDLKIKGGAALVPRL